MYTLLPRFNINYIQYAENICVSKLCPSRRIRFVTHISICHSFLVPQEPRLHPFRMDCLMAMGLGGVCGGVGDSGLWGVGGRVQRTQTSLYNSNSILLFAQIKHKPTFTLCFTQPFTYFHLKRLLFCVKIK